MIKPIKLKRILATCDSEQDGQYHYLLKFTSMQERDLWLYYYENLVRKYCAYITVFKTQPRIAISMNDAQIMKDVKQFK